MSLSCAAPLVSQFGIPKQSRRQCYNGITESEKKRWRDIVLYERERGIGIERQW